MCFCTLSFSLFNLAYKYISLRCCACKPENNVTQKKFFWSRLASFAELEIRGFGKHNIKALKQACTPFRIRSFKEKKKPLKARAVSPV